MILDQISIIIKIFILGIFIAIMFDNISKYCHFVIAIILWIPIIYVICKVLINICIYYEFSYIVYYLLTIVLSYIIYYKYLKKDLNSIIDKIINKLKNSKKVKKVVRFIFLIDEFKYLKLCIIRGFKKIKRKKLKKDSKTFDFLK